MFFFYRERRAYVVRGGLVGGEMCKRGSFRGGAGFFLRPNLGRFPGAVAAHAATLRSLVLKGTIIATGASRLAAALRQTQRLTKLNLCGTALKNSGATAVAEALSALPLPATLRYLGLSGCGISAGGAVGVANAVSSPPLAGLQHVDMDDNRVGRVGQMALTDAILSLSHVMVITTASTDGVLAISRFTTD